MIRAPPPLLLLLPPPPEGVAGKIPRGARSDGAARGRSTGGGGLRAAWARAGGGGAWRRHGGEGGGGQGQPHRSGGAPCPDLAPLGLCRCSRWPWPEDDGGAVRRGGTYREVDKGEGIHVFVPQCLEYKFSMQIEEGRVYYFRNFNTRPIRAGSLWRCAYRSYELRFTTETDVRPIVPEPDDFPLYAYRLRSFKDLLHTVTDNTYLADVVGLVTGISDIMTFKVKQKRTVRLYDGSDHAIIHLWDEFADELDADELIRTSKSEPVILLAMGFMFGKEYSMLSLKTAYGCRICINPASSDILAFRNRIIGIDHSIERIDDRGDRLCALVVGNTSVTNLVSEGCSPGAVNTGSCDLVAEHTVSAAQEHNAELSSSALALAPGERETPKQRACYFGTPQAASASSNEKKGESDGRTEVATVFLDTNLGSGLAVPAITSASTVADLKRRVSDEHAAAFPSFGKMLGNAVCKMLNSQVARLFGYRWFWCRQEFKPEYKLAHPYTDNERRITAEAAKWRSMTADEKAPYFSKAQERKVEYSGS